jgi:hypothetical protein
MAPRGAETTKPTIVQRGISDTLPAAMTGRASQRRPRASWMKQATALPGFGKR